MKIKSSDSWRQHYLGGRRSRRPKVSSGRATHPQHRSGSDRLASKVRRRVEWLDCDASEPSEQAQKLTPDLVSPLKDKPSSRLDPTPRGASISPDEEDAEQLVVGSGGRGERGALAADDHASRAESDPISNEAMSRPCAPPTTTTTGRIWDLWLQWSPRWGRWERRRMMRGFGAIFSLSACIWLCHQPPMPEGDRLFCAGTHQSF